MLIYKIIKNSNNNHLSDTEKSLFLHQLTLLLAAGISIIECLAIIEESCVKPTTQQLANSIKQAILNGQSLFASLQHQPHFNPLTKQLIHIGEQTGKLTYMLSIATQELESQYQLKEAIHKALFYPCIVTSCAICLFLLMCIFIIPRFMDLFQSISSDLPLLTKFIFFLANIIRHFTWLIILAFISLILLYSHHSSRAILSNRIRQYIKRIPILRHIIRLSHLTHFSRQLACAYNAGIPIIDSLSILSDAHEEEFKQEIIRLQFKMRYGWPMHTAMETLPIFPTLMRQLIRIGEESGKLDLMLAKIVELYTSEINRTIHRCTQLLEPLIMIVLGVLIGGLVIGMYLPIFKLGSAF